MNGLLGGEVQRFRQLVFIRPSTRDQQGPQPRDLQRGPALAKTCSSVLGLPGGSAFSTQCRPWISRRSQRLQRNAWPAG